MFLKRNKPPYITLIYLQFRFCRKAPFSSKHNGESFYNHKNFLMKFLQLNKSYDKTKMVWYKVFSDHNVSTIIL